MIDFSAMRTRTSSPPQVAASATTVAMLGEAVVAPRDAQAVAPRLQELTAQLEVNDAAASGAGDGGSNFDR